MIIDDEVALELGTIIMSVADPTFSGGQSDRATFISLGKIAFKLIAPKVLEMIREPTSAMMSAGNWVQHDNDQTGVSDIWRAMIDKLREDYGG